MKKLNKKLKENLYSEIHILKRLHHPHIVALIDCQETTAHIHLIMEFCELGDLSYFIRKRDTLGRHDTTADMIKKYPNPAAGGLNEVVVRHFLKQLASALEFLREKDFIHRDVKPQNLLLDPSPEFYANANPETVPYAAHANSLVPATGISSLPTLKLADFGFARSLPSTSLAETLCGSPLYMAPEILRYEKYDAKADLWSVGTVTFEMMVGKPPFRAQNHVELLRRIEKGDDRIKFPEEVVISEAMKRLIRGLLKRNPVERTSFADFFNSPAIKDEIPGLVGNDRPIRQLEQEQELQSSKSSGQRQATPESERLPKDDRISKADASGTVSQAPRKPSPLSQPSTVGTANPIIRRSSGTTPSAIAQQARRVEQRSEPTKGVQESRDRAPQARRPSMVSHATAPARQDLQIGERRNNQAAVVQRRSSRDSSSPKQSSPLQHVLNQDMALQERDHQVKREVREARERAAQDVAFERDYVLVEKRAVEVNAFADELAASPRIHAGIQAQQDAQRGAMVRRATTQGSPTSTTGAQITPSRALQIACGKRPEHRRQSSYDRRVRDTTSATSAISKAINMASGRLFSMGFSPPLSLGRGGPSPPAYNPFPAYAIAQGSLPMIGDGTKAQGPMSEDVKVFHLVEEGATRSDVVYCFAEVKYKQLIPLAPSTHQGLGIRQASTSGDEGDINDLADDGLTVDAIVTLSEEALVLYVKALAILDQALKAAGTWWSRKNRGEVPESASPRTQASPASKSSSDSRIISVVQWLRNRFNEVCEKAAYVRLRLTEAQKQLPADHSSHPSNQHAASSSATGTSKSAEDFYVSNGLTAEKLMYDRALEMSRSAAVNELVGEDFAGCEIAYVTAIRMLQAVLQDDEESYDMKPTSSEREAKASKSGDESVNVVEAEDREVVLKRKLVPNVVLTLLDANG